MAKSVLDLNRYVNTMADSGCRQRPRDLTSSESRARPFRLTTVRSPGHFQTVIVKPGLMMEIKVN